MQLKEELLRAVTYVCMTPAAWCEPEVCRMRSNAVSQRITTKHWPHEFQVVDRRGEKGSNELGHACTKSESTFTQMQTQLVLPDRFTPGRERGVPSLARAQRFCACGDVVPVRGSPSTEWGEPVKYLKKGAFVEGHVFGDWLLLARADPPSDDADADDAWVSISSEKSQGRALAPYVA